MNNKILVENYTVDLSTPLKIDMPYKLWALWQGTGWVSSGQANGCDLMVYETEKEAWQSARMHAEEYDMPCFPVQIMGQ